MISLLLALNLNARAMYLESYQWKNRVLVLQGNPQLKLIDSMPRRQQEMKP